MRPLRLLVFPASQYPPRKRFFNRRVLAFGLGHLAGLAIAAAWLATRIVGEARGAPLTLPLAGAILRNMRNGPYYYFFVGLALVGCGLHFMAVRPWLELLERKESAAGGAPDAGDRGRPQRVTPATSPCRDWESNLAAAWSVLALALSAIILILTVPRHGPPDHLFLWAYTAVGVAFNVWISARAFRHIRLRESA